jgi:hypothetical protein
VRGWVEKEGDEISFHQRTAFLGFEPSWYFSLHPNTAGGREEGEERREERGEKKKKKKRACH